METLGASSLDSPLISTMHLAPKKGASLESKANELLATDADIVPKTVLQSRPMDNENYADQEATESTCALLLCVEY